MVLRPTANDGHHTPRPRERQGPTGCTCPPPSDIAGLSEAALGGGGITPKRGPDEVASDRRSHRDPPART
jgi:hypothetical protein